MRKTSHYERHWRGDRVAAEDAHDPPPPSDAVDPLPPPDAVDPPPPSDAVDPPPPEAGDVSVDDPSAIDDQTIDASPTLPGESRKAKRARLRRERRATPEGAK